VPVASATTACPRAGPGAPAVYRPRRPAVTVLHRTVREHLETFLARARSSDPDLRPIRPAAERALREYLRCGIAAHGFARVYCDSCRHDYLVPFSCKVRDLCPSCGSRRMVETAAHLVDTVLPGVPYRQWVVSVPKRVRWFLKHRPEALDPVPLVDRGMGRSRSMVIRTGPVTLSVGCSTKIVAGLQQSRRGNYRSTTLG
jgi:hypothetical protein